MTLSQALKEIKKRGRSVPIDGVYSILGLLPYGEHVKVDYNLAPEQALYDVMKIAFGHRSKIEMSNYTLTEFPRKETVREILPDGRLVIEYREENGYGGIDISLNDVCDYFEEGKGLVLFSSQSYIICEVGSSIQKLEGGFETEAGLYKKDVKVKTEIVKADYERIQKTLELVKENRYLVVPSLVELGNDKLQGGDYKQVVIGAKNYQVESQYQARIEIIK
ncbi:13959_t:CDS:2 [Ambispora leptoticha]|uniref:13959_t:CDS:1 n=1 Tax=Ambispora leptoticha TaxID=144679 RepID=A0A9N9A9P1_9GLOM|nr:13959_t:CDS:2 [Ambispora leptoticha]